MLKQYSVTREASFWEHHEADRTCLQFSSALMVFFCPKELDTMLLKCISGFFCHISVNHANILSAVNCEKYTQSSSSVSWPQDSLDHLT